MLAKEFPSALIIVLTAGAGLGLDPRERILQLNRAGQAVIQRLPLEVVTLELGPINGLPADQNMVLISRPSAEVEAISPGERKTWNASQVLGFFMVDS